METIRDLVHAQFLNTRNINNLVQSDNFEIVYKLASKEEQDKILLAIGEMNKDKIKEFIHDKLLDGTPFEQLGIRKLREIGRYLKVVNYHALNKLTLIEEIKNVAERLKKDSERKHLQSQETIKIRKDIA